MASSRALVWSDWALAEPHDEHGACGEDDREVDDGPETKLESASVSCPVDLHLKVDQVGGSLDDPAGGR